MPERKLDIKASVAIRLEVSSALGEFIIPCLILVRQQNGQVGLPAGKCDLPEDPRSAMGRELFQETGLTGIADDLQGPRTFTHEDKFENKFRIAFVFTSKYTGDLPHPKEWPVNTDPDNDIVSARLFDPLEIRKLIESPDNIYRPEYNLPALIDWVVYLANVRHDHGSRVFLRRQIKLNKIEGLNVDNRRFSYIWPGEINSPKTNRIVISNPLSNH